MKNNSNGRKSQFLVVGVIMVVLSAILLFAMMPAITGTINSVSSTVDSDTRMLMGILPAAIVLAMILGIFGYVRFRAQYQQGPPRY